MAEYKPWLDWQEQLEKEMANKPNRARVDDALSVDAGEISLVAAGAGIGAVAAVPALMVILALVSPNALSEGQLVAGALTAPLIGAGMGALAGRALTRIVERLSR